MSCACLVAPDVRACIARPLRGSRRWCARQEGRPLGTSCGWRRGCRMASSPTRAPRRLWSTGLAVWAWRFLSSRQRSTPSVPASPPLPHSGVALARAIPRGGRARYTDNSECGSRRHCHLSYRARGRGCLNHPRPLLFLRPCLVHRGPAAGPLRAAGCIVRLIGCLRALKPLLGL